MQSETTFKTLIGTLQRCRQKKDLSEASRLRELLYNRQLDTHFILGNYLVPTLVGCGCLQDAHSVFDHLKHQERSEYSWTSLISGYNACGRPHHALQLFDRMQMENCACPTSHTLVAVLNACARLEDSETGHGIHITTTKHGLDGHLHVASSLVYMYGKCRLLAEARHVFDRMPCKNVISWNSLIYTYADNGSATELLGFFEKMQNEGVPVVTITFVSGLRTCISLRDLQTGQTLHTEAVKMGFERGLHVGSTLVDLYGKLGSHAEMHQTFHGLLTRDAVSWTALIGGYVEHGNFGEALSCYKQMQVEGIHPDSATFVCILKICGSTKALDMGSEIHDEIVRAGIEQDYYVGNSLLDMYSKCNLHMEACNVLDCLLIQDAVSWNALISAYAEQGLTEEALDTFKCMQQEGVLPNEGTFICMFKLCGATRALEISQELHMQVSKRGFETDLQIDSILVDMYSKCGLLVEAHQLVHALHVKDSAAWNALLAGYARKGCGEQVLYCFDKMLSKGVPCDAVTYACCLNACRAMQLLEKGLELHMEVVMKGMDQERSVSTTLMVLYNRCDFVMEACQVPNKDAAAGFVEERLDEAESLQLEGILSEGVLHITDLTICGTKGTLGECLKIHTEVTKKGLERELLAGNMFVDMYGKCGSIDEACIVFQGLKSQNIVSWNALITSLAEHGLTEEVMGSFKVMQQQSVSPNAVILVCGLKACSIEKSVKLGCMLHHEIVKKGIEKHSNTGSSLIMMYCACGLFTEAQWVFDSLPVKDTVLWTTMVAGCIENGCEKEILKCINKLRLEAVHGDAGLYVCSLEACSSIGAIEKGRELHSEVVKRGLEGDLYVGNTVIDMYIKCGLLIEAHSVFDRLNVKNVISWNTLITGYAECGTSVEVFNLVKQMQLGGVPMDAITFISTLKSCSTSGALETGQVINSEVIEQGIENELDVSNALIDMYGKCGLTIDACQVFNSLPAQDTVLWTSLVAGYSEKGLEKEVLKCFQNMMKRRVFISPITFLCSLKACGNVEALQTGYHLHTEIAKRGFERELCVGCALVDMYGKCGLLVEAHGVLDRLPVRDLVSWTALLVSCSKHGSCEEYLSFSKFVQSADACIDDITCATGLKACGTVGDLQRGQEIHFEIVKRGFERVLQVGSSLVAMYGSCHSLPEACIVFDKLSTHSVVSWNVLLSSYMEQGLNHDMLNCFKQMLLEGVSPEAVTYVLCLKACGEKGLLESGHEIHFEVIKAGLEKNCYVANMLVGMYGKCSSVLEGREVFNSLPAQDVISWTVMIKAYGENNEGKMAVQCLEEMEAQGVKPNTVTFICIIAACSHSSLIHHGQECFMALMTYDSVKPTNDHYACMVDLFARSGDFNEAERIMEAMQCSQSQEILRAVLTGCKCYSEVELGHRCFQMLLDMHKGESSACSL